MCDIKLIHAEGAEYLSTVRRLFREYQHYLGVDLSFQDFEKELSRLPAPYTPPAGAILLALIGHETAGCVALKDLGSGICEMKRLYVRPVFRGRGLGRGLAEAVIKEAQMRGYITMRLDTLKTLTEAMKLYELLGFKRIAPYYANPLPDVVYWERALTNNR